MSIKQFIQEATEQQGSKQQSMSDGVEASMQASEASYPTNPAIMQMFFPLHQQIKQKEWNKFSLQIAFCLLNSERQRQACMQAHFSAIRDYAQPASEHVNKPIIKQPEEINQVVQDHFQFYPKTGLKACEQTSKNASTLANMQPKK